MGQIFLPWGYPGHLLVRVGSVEEVPKYQIRMG